MSYKANDGGASHATFDTVASSASWAPGRAEAWWWLAIPIVCGLSLFAVNAISPQFYLNSVLPEGFGVLEFTQFWVLMAGFFIALALLRFQFIRGSGLMMAAAIVFALTCLFIAGEEMSWGQHFLHWSTPGYWAEINRQDETNLHNVSPWFNQRPRLVLEIGVLVGGILLPLWQIAKGPFRHPFLALFVPPPEILPAGLTYAVFKIVDHVTKRGDYMGILPRPNEAVESCIYLFLLYYLIVFYRRVRALEAVGVRELPAG